MEAELVLRSVVLLVDLALPRSVLLPPTTPLPSTPASARRMIAYKLLLEITVNTVGLSSTVRRKRYHHEVMIRRASFDATSPRSSITRPTRRHE